MMVSEFIERTGFEPTAQEYEEIEQEYMGCDIDKDTFCKQWKKNGGIQRLSRQRARRIEELESKVAMQDRQYDEMDLRHCERFNAMRDKMAAEASELKTEIERLKAELENAQEVATEMAKRSDQANAKLRQIKAVFEILTGKEGK